MGSGNLLTRPYRNLQELFLKVMRKSDELYHENMRAKRIFNRLLREKNRISDILLQLNESSHVRNDLKADLIVSATASNQHQSIETMSDMAKHHLGLIDDAFDFSSDEEDHSYNNPMSIHEWIHRDESEDYLEYLDSVLTGTAVNKTRKRKDSERRGSDSDEEKPRKKRIE
jgi:hypothetical protein